MTCYTNSTVASAPTDLIASHEGPTSVRVSWSPPDPLGDTTGYVIYYSTDGSSDSVDVSGPDGSETILEDLMTDSRYLISLVAISQHLPSETLTRSIQLLGNMGMVPYMPGHLGHGLRCP